ncbi:MAG: aminotransferase class V-fold PLP-dependent enzyme [Saprospiraceae bacterium]|nr:aminotransferase class V-fold PLP-dependent enzyme [Saprospiraceae bacterium]
MLDTITNESLSKLESYFSEIRKHIIGHDFTIETPYGQKPLLYADWIASGRLYRPIESRIVNDLGPYVANTHTETTTTGCSMTLAYIKARQIIKDHVNANEDDILISTHSGMTGVVNKFQRILGLRLHEKYLDEVKIDEKPLVICSHMEHHSNQTSWIETIADVITLDPCPKGMVNCENLVKVLEEHKHRKVKIAAITSCSNVTGIFTPYFDVAEIMHKHGGLCFVDFACAAPYIDIDMHPENRPDAYLDAIYFSPHKFLGGPGGTGVLVFNKSLYNNRIPDNPGGGTVDWTNPWGEHKYHDEIEAREDGGTPAFLQTIKVGLSIQLKEQIGVKNIKQREEEIIERIWPKLAAIPNLNILADHIKDRLSVISFYIDNAHYNLIVKLLNDRFGIQTRGGCSCAGTYGHYLLSVSQEQSKDITDKINSGDLTCKPGWIRLSLHPVMTNKDIDFIADAISEIAMNFPEWSKDYIYQGTINEFVHKDKGIMENAIVENWFDKSLI